ncbi:exosortase X [Hymenobacter latericus]|uniref:exosortase X n=1 Tax=Hymenobacter sp. YIM 151858-1 TaxID=2987688 RepID=UPI0022263C85|nr:archaeosortase/exosortase family protein [Hymenobacter sp. YIM 151858-1]UYZ57819.1 archaeosortase/exosortase family protein [Hymenobacter sp. YIM 151858-1]
MHDRTPNHRALLRFALSAGALYLLWYVGYELWLRPAGKLDEALSLNLASVSAAVLRAVSVPAAAAGRMVLVAGKPAVWVGDPCNGQVLYALFVGFILAFPGGSWRRKLPFMALGILAIYGLNIVRVGALTLNHLYSRGTVDFNHHYTFTFVVYGCIFLLWMLWVRRFASPQVPSHA